MKKAKAGTYQEWAIRHVLSLLNKEQMNASSSSGLYRTQGAANAIIALTADLKRLLPEDK